MKKTFFLLAALCWLTTVSAQTRITVDDLSAKWQSQNLKAPKSGGILDLVRTFNNVYPTYSVGEFLKDVERPADQQQWIITVDRPNGFVSFAEGSDDASSESMQACVWKRRNGHKLFAISFEQQFSQVKSLLAFFDLDPATGVLKPEKSLARIFTPSSSDGIIHVNLPQHGKDIKISEYYINAMFSINHVYPWDGMGPGRELVEIENLDKMWAEYKAQAMMDGDHPAILYALIDIDRDHSPELLLRSDSEDYQAVFALYDGKYELIAAKDYKRSLNFYPPKAVGSAGGCGTGCFFIEWTLLENSRPKHRIENQQEYNFEKDALEDHYSLDGREVVHAEEGDRLVKSFGEPTGISIAWHSIK